jgi:hypothetical protein
MLANDMSLKNVAVEYKNLYYKNINFTNKLNRLID